MFNPAPYPIVVGGTLYIEAYNQQLLALNATTGASVWPDPALTGSGGLGLAGAGNIVYVGGSDSRAYAFNAATGAEIGEHLYDDSFSSPLTIVNNVVYAGVGGHYLMALNASNGAIIWQLHLGSTGSDAPAVVNGVVYVAANDNRVYAANASNGKLIWSVIVSGGVSGTGSTLAAVGGLIYVQCTDGTIKAFRMTDGSSALPSTPSPSQFGVQEGSFAVGNRLIYVGGYDPTTNSDGMFAYDALTGAQQWFQPISGQALTPAVANGVVYFGTNLNDEYALDAATGAQ